MRKLISIFNYVAVVPLAIMLASNLAPIGSDSRGYGPAFVVGILSCLISGIFTVSGVVLCFAAGKAQAKVLPTSIATIVAFVPAAILIVGILMGRA